METASVLSASGQELRRYMRDLTAITALPSIWRDANPAGIAESLADVLMQVLPLNFAYVRLNEASDHEVIEVARSGQAFEATDLTAVVGDSLREYLDSPNTDT